MNVCLSTSAELIRPITKRPHYKYGLVGAADVVNDAYGLTKVFSRHKSEFLVASTREEDAIIQWLRLTIQASYHCILPSGWWQSSHHCCWWIDGSVNVGKEQEEWYAASFLLCF